MADPTVGGAGNRPTDALQYERRIAENDAQARRTDRADQTTKVRQQQTADARQASAERTTETQRQASANNARGQYVDIRA
jgi:hypothetical protein